MHRSVSVLSFAVARSGWDWRVDASGRSRRAAGYPQIAVVLAVHLTSPGYGAARLLPVVVVEEAAIG